MVLRCPELAFSGPPFFVLHFQAHFQLTAWRWEASCKLRCELVARVNCKRGRANLMASCVTTWTTESMSLWRQREAAEAVAADGQHCRRRRPIHYSVFRQDQIPFTTKISNKQNHGCCTATLYILTFASLRLNESKNGTYSFAHNFTKYWLILKILLPANYLGNLHWSLSLSPGQLATLFYESVENSQGLWVWSRQQQINQSYVRSTTYTCGRGRWAGIKPRRPTIQLWCSTCQVASLLSYAILVWGDACWIWMTEDWEAQNTWILTSY